MKKRHPLLFVILVTLLLSVACNLGSRKKTVRVNNANESLKIEYKGELFFNTNGTGIDEISPGGYVKYRRNGKKFIAEPNDSGNVEYTLYIDDRRLDWNDTSTRALFKAAMQEIIDHYER